VSADAAATVGGQAGAGERAEPTRGDHHAYLALEERFRRIAVLDDAEAMLHWDMATMMPPGGAAARAEQLAVLRGLRHGLIAQPEVAELLDAARDTEGLGPWQRANVREMAREHAHATALTEAQVEALSRATSTCEAAWRQARAESDFALVRPALAALLDLVREAAQAKGEALGLSPYDALLDEYEPGCRAAEIEPLFDDLAAFLPGLLARVMERQARQPEPAPPPRGPFPVDAQRALAVRLMGHLGFDFAHGRLDVSLHPFCGGTPDDVRITTRYAEDDFRSALMGVLHETGHALYERGLPAPWRGQPVGRARGMALHESQSLLVEMQVCRSEQFLRFAAPLIREAFAPDDGRGGGATGGLQDRGTWSVEGLKRHYTRVAPGLIRVDADEVTYPAHVILRTRLEQDMLAGRLAVADLPAAWNEAMIELLGVAPPDDRSGCLQDIHWYDGAWGYFPTYTLGAMAAAQIFAAARAAEPALQDGIARGDFAPLVDWLRAHVHGPASSASTAEILTHATGGPLSTRAFREHLTRRYLG
jgi:carboxypeptidase Taq